MAESCIRMKQNEVLRLKAKKTLKRKEICVSAAKGPEWAHKCWPFGGKGI